MQIIYQCNKISLYQFMCEFTERVKQSVILYLGNVIEVELKFVVY